MKTSNVKRILCGCLLFAATWPAFSQPATNPRLIIRADDMGSFRFANITAWGIKEHYVAALHYCATMPKIEDEADKEMLIEHVLKPAAKFFCADNDDMDNEIINEELAKWN